MKLKNIILIILLSVNLLASQIVEFAGDQNYPPYSYSQDGVAKGIYVDILKSAFAKMPGYDLKINMMAFKRAIKMTKLGKTIGFFPPYYSKERKKWAKFSEPLLSETTVVFTKKETLKDKKNFPEDFYGLRVCLNRGFGKFVLGGEKFAQAIKDKKILLIEADNNQACMSRIVRGIADFYINDQLIDTSKFPIIVKGMIAKSNNGHVAFTLEAKNYPFIEDLEKKFNKTVKLMKKNGDIEIILSNYR